MNVVGILLVTYFLFDRKIERKIPHSCTLNLHKLFSKAAHALQCYQCSGNQLNDDDCVRLINCGDNSYCGISNTKFGHDGVKRVSGCYQRGSNPEYEYTSMNSCYGETPYRMCICNTDWCNSAAMLLSNRASLGRVVGISYFAAIIIFLLLVF